MFKFFDPDDTVDDCDFLQCFRCMVGPFMNKEVASFFKVLLVKHLNRGRLENPILPFSQNLLMHLFKKSKAVVSQLFISAVEFSSCSQ